MDRLINIKFKDADDWEDVSGISVIWDNYNEFLNQALLRYDHIPPVVVTDTWGGVNFDVQLLKWQGYFAEFLINNTDIHELEKVLSCSDVIVTDMVNDISHTVDASKSEYMQLEFNPVADVLKQAVKFAYRTHKTIINKKQPILDTYRLTSGVNIYPTDIELIYKQEETKQAVYSNDSGVETMTNTLTKETANLLFYLSETDRNSLVENFETSDNNYIQLQTYTMQSAQLDTIADSGFYFDAILGDNVKVGQYITLDSQPMQILTISTGRTFITTTPYASPWPTIGSNLYVTDIIDIIAPSKVKNELIGENLYRCEVNGQI